MSAANQSLIIMLMIAVLASTFIIGAAKWVRRAAVVLVIAVLLGFTSQDCAAPAPLKMPEAVDVQITTTKGEQ